jgi:hypothetical protein
MNALVWTIDREYHPRMFGYPAKKAKKEGNAS